MYGIQSFLETICERSGWGKQNQNKK